MNPEFSPHQQNALAMMERGERDPVWWIDMVLGAHFWPKQALIAEALVKNRTVAARSCHGVGKSFASGHIDLWYLYTHMPSIVITTAPGERQVKGILWKEIRTAHSKAKVPLGGELLKLQLNLADDWFMWGFTAPEYDPDKFMGFHCENILIDVDEACGVAQEIYDGGITALMSNAGARLLMTGNPTDPTGYFAQTFSDPPPNTALFKIDAFDTPNFYAFGIVQEDIESGEWIDKLADHELPMPGLVAPQWVAEVYKKWGKDDPRYQARVLANFPPGHDKQLWQMAWIDDAMEPPEKNQIQPGKRRFGVDPAHFGSNETVIAYKNGNFTKIIGGRMGLDTLEVAGWVKTAGIEYGIKEASVDTIGIGQGVVDQLKAWHRYGQLPFEVIPIRGDARPGNPEMFVNLRAELHWHVRTQLEKRKMKIQPNDELRKQMLNLRFDYRNGRIIIESKEDYKKRMNGDSPDRSDALVYANSDEVKSGKVVVLF